jgi:hypothetical protein
MDINMAKLCLNAICIVFHKAYSLSIVVRVQWFDYWCKVNSDEFDRIQRRTGWRFLSQVAG